MAARLHAKMFKEQIYASATQIWLGVCNPSLSHMGQEPERCASLNYNDNIIDVLSRHCMDSCVLMQQDSGEVEGVLQHKNM